MRRKHGIVLSTGCLALLLLIAIPEAAFAQNYGYEIAPSTATSRSPTVVLGTSLALDGHSVSSTNCSPCSLSITTTLAQDVIVVIVEGNSGATSCSVSDTKGLAWNTRTGCTSVPAGPGVMRTYGVYWAVAASSLSSDSITVTITGGSNMRLLIFAVNGANTLYPFDLSASIPSYSSGGPPSACTMTTSNANDFLFSTAQQGGNPVYTLPTGFTAIDSTPFGEESEDAYYIVNTAQAGVPESWGVSSGGSGAVVTTCDAIVAAGNVGSSTNSLNTAVAVTIPSPISGSSGTSYFENANGPVPCSVTTDTSTTAPGTSNSFTFNSPQTTCLVTPVFASTTSIQSGAWLADLWVSATGIASLSLALDVVTSAGAVITADSAATVTVTTIKTETKTYLSSDSLLIPSGDYVELLITPLAATATYTLYWGSGQLTLLQQPNTYGVLVSIINPSNTASYTINLGYVGVSNNRISNMTIFIGAPTSRQIIIGTGIGSPTQPNTFGPTVVLSPSRTMFIGLGVSTTNVGTTLVTITLKIQVGGGALGSTVAPYCQDTILITVN